MAKVKTRIAQLEKEARFRLWFNFSRFLEAMSDEQLKDIALDWRFPEPLPAFQKDAAAKGFLLIARKAARTHDQKLASR